MTGQYKHYKRDEKDPFDLKPFVKDAKYLGLVLLIITLLAV